jgi:protein HOOK3
MEMEESAQQELMVLIQRAMQAGQGDGDDSRDDADAGEDAGGGGGGGGGDSSSKQQLAEALDARDAAETRMADMKKEVAELHEKNEQLHTQLQSHAASGQGASAAADDALLDLQDELRSAQKAAAMHEAGKRDLEDALASKDRELQRLKEGQDLEVAKLEADLAKQQEEMDIARSQGQELAKTQATLAKYREKLEAVGEFRQQMKDLEEQNSQYLDKMLDMESELKIIPGLKLTLEKYKDQVVDLETSSVGLKSKCSVQEDDIARLREDIESKDSAKEFLEEQLETLRSENQQYASGEHSGGGGGGIGEDSLGGMGLGAGIQGGEAGMSLKEKCARLEREVRGLKQAGGDGAEGELMRHQMEDMERLKASVEGKNAQILTEKARVEVELEEMRKMVEALQDKESAGEEQMSAASQAEVAQLRAQLESARAHQANMRGEVEKLQVALQEEQAKPPPPIASPAKEKEKESGGATPAGFVSEAEHSQVRGTDPQRHSKLHCRNYSEKTTVSKLHCNALYITDCRHTHTRRWPTR